MTGKIKVCIIGTRGIPAKYGGFETFAEEIAPLLAASGFEIFVQCEPGNEENGEFKGVKLFYSSVSKTMHPLRYFNEGIQWGVRNSDILLVASTAGSLFYFQNIFRHKVIITNPDGLEHKREKWSFPKKTYLKFSEFLAVKLSDFLVADSTSIKDYLVKSYRNVAQKVRVIEYGAYQNRYSDNEALNRYGLVPNGYYLVVCRLEPENNIEMILDSYAGAATVSKLVVVGNLTDSRYVRSLVTRFSSDRIIFTGGIYDRKELNALRFSCKAYIHGHSVGGTNPSLLEAMGSHNLILAHDNEFNREVTMNSQLYFDSAGECRKGINQIELMTEDEVLLFKESGYKLVSEKYNWNRILNKYLDLISEISRKLISDG